MQKERKTLFGLVKREKKEEEKVENVIEMKTLENLSYFSLFGFARK